MRNRPTGDPDIGSFQTQTLLAAVSNPWPHVAQDDYENGRTQNHKFT